MTTAQENVQALAFSHVEDVEHTPTPEPADEAAGPQFSAPTESHAPFPAPQTNRTH